MIAWGDTFSISDAALVEAIMCVFSRLARPVVIGLCGAQGSGKSTTARRLVERLEQERFRAVVCSLDDFYLSHNERGLLGQAVHPLLATRGVPGTHDISLLGSVIRDLLAARPVSNILMPVFDKLVDDRLPRKDWVTRTGETDIVIIEGWCVGARPQPQDLLVKPVNELERTEDAELIWRRYVNAQLADAYAKLFNQIDLQVMLKAPSFDCIYQWRVDQEAQLAAESQRQTLSMSSESLLRFIAHYQRISEWLLQGEHADLVVDLDEARRPVRIRTKGRTEKPV